MKKLILLFSIVLITGVFLQAQTVDVTFQVDMSVKIATGYFDPGTEVVTCPGDFNNWLNEPPPNTDKVMEDPDNDSVYTITIAMAPNTTYGYKFNIGLGWDGKDETGGNREVVVGASNMTVDPSFFNDYNPYTGIQSPVIFSVDMQLPAQGDFDPGTDHVFIAGSFTNWGTDAIEMFDQDNDSIYTVTVDSLISGDLAIYKFVYSPDTAPNGTWESPTEGDDIFPPDNNRIYGVHDDTNFVSRNWNNVDPNVTLADGNIFFEVDMSVLTELGVFDPNVDSVQIRGAFNGWSTLDPDKALMTQNAANPDHWTIEIPLIQVPLNSNQLYKFFINDADSNYSNTGWEVPVGNTNGSDRNRGIIFQGDPAQSAPYTWFENINTDWVIPAGTTVECTFRVDMTNAADPLIQNPPFVPGTDTVWWIPRHPLYYAVNGLTWPGEYPRVLELTDPDLDMIYEGTLTLNGPSYNGWLYNYAYSNATDLIHEGPGGPGSPINQGDSRVRFVEQTGIRSFVSPYTMPLDVWSNDPLPEEEQPAGWVNSVKGIAGNPQTYSLEQNYPNPFNPSTTIRFSIPEQGLVTLKVFNLLGEEVATLINSELTNGNYEVDFSASNFSSGIYFYTLKAANFVSTKKMILLK
jgi:hypothetical protein